ncbi:MAG: ABC transporter permease [Bacteroidota bacterium]
MSDDRYSHRKGMPMFTNWKTSLIFLFLSGLILLFIVAPLAGMFIQTSGSRYVETIVDPEVGRSIRLTLFSSLLGVVVFGIAAIPLAYVLARKHFPGKGIINGLVDLPVVIPHSAAGIAILGVVSRGTWIGQAGDAAGIHFVGGMAGIVVAMAFVSIPFLINAARDGFQAVPVKLEKAALNLGASPWRVFFTISLPLAKRQVLTGLTMMWARGLSEFGAVVIIAYHPMITPVLIWERFTSFGLDYARPVAAVFVLVCLAVFTGLRILAGKGPVARH